jgi:hypothetical protein
MIPRFFHDRSCSDFSTSLHIRPHLPFHDLKMLPAKRFNLIICRTGIRILPQIQIILIVLVQLKIQHPDL